MKYQIDLDTYIRAYHQYLNYMLNFCAIDVWTIQLLKHVNVSVFDGHDIDILTLTSCLSYDFSPFRNWM